MWASIANETDVGVLFAKTDRDAGAKGVTAFIVAAQEVPGLEGAADRLLGLSKSLRTNVVFLDDFVVPVENRLGEEGEGFKIIMRTLQPGPRGVAAKALGVARRCFEEAVRYANERTVRGQPIGRFQMIQSDIAEMATAIEASRALVYKAAHDDGQQPAVQPHRRDRQVPRLADGQDVRRQGACRSSAATAWPRSTASRGYRAYADMFFTGEGSANVQKIMIAEDALGYKLADRHHGKTGPARHPQERRRGRRRSRAYDWRQQQ